MSYILSNPTLLTTLQNEVYPAISEGTTGLEYKLEQHCPRLRAVYLEVLRLTSSSSTVRGVMQPTDIGDKTLKTGASILIPYRRLHLNPEIFGENAEDFDPERFLRDPSLSKNPNFRPFGGGILRNARSLPLSRWPSIASISESLLALLHRLRSRCRTFRGWIRRSSAWGSWNR